jgi:hypothetical protein
MEQQYVEVIDESHKDFGHNWVSSSRFLFYCQVFLFLAMVGGCSYSLYTHRWKGKPEVEVPANTQYNPQYK